MQLFSRTVDRIFSVIGVLLFCQLPLFIMQYETMLQGHLLECTQQRTFIEASALKSNKSLESYIDKFLKQADSDFVQQGIMMQHIEQRYTSLHTSYSALKKASFWQRPFVFVATLQGDIARTVWESFTPGIATTQETVVYAFLGLAFGVLVYSILIRGMRWLMSLIYRKRKVPE